MRANPQRGAEQAGRPRPTRAQRLVAFGFLAAFGLTLLTVLLTGLWVRAPRERANADPPAQGAPPTHAQAVESPAAGDHGEAGANP